MTLSVKNRVRLVLAAFLVTALGVAATTTILLQGMMLDSRVVNHAGIVRGASQRLVKLELAGKPSDKLIRKIELIATGLREGSTELDLPRATDDTFIRHLEKLRADWALLKDAIMLSRANPELRARLLEQSEAFFTTCDQTVSAAEAFSHANVVWLRRGQMLLVGINIVLGLGAVIFLMSPLNALVRTVGAFARRLEQRDLGARMEIHSQDEFGQVAGALNAMAAELCASLRRFAESARALDASSRELLANGQQAGKSSKSTAGHVANVAEAATHVSDNIASVATAAEELNATVKEIARHTSEVSQISGEAAASADQTNETITRLAASSREIENVIKMINAIATKTELLSVNASVEAARAGVSGRGFAVVASQVRELSVQTSEATGNIARRIHAIQADTNAAISALKGISELVRRIDQAQVTIASAVEEESAATTEIARNATEASGSSARIASRMGQVSTDTQKSSDAASGAMSAAARLAEIAADLQNGVMHFRFDENTAAGTGPTSDNPASGAPKGPGRGWWAWKPRRRAAA